MDYSLFEWHGDVQMTVSPLFDQVCSSFTYEFWVKPEKPHNISFESTFGVAGLIGQQYVIGPGHANDPYKAGAGVSVGTNGVSVLEHTVNYLPTLLVYETPIHDWVHVAIVYIHNTPYLYLNGEYKKRGLTSDKLVYASGIFGALDSFGYFTGQIRELRIWDYPKQESQLKQEMHMKTNGNESGLVFYLAKEREEQSIPQEEESIFVPKEAPPVPVPVQQKKTIVVIDRYVPHYDRDAGSRSTFHYIKLFIEMGLVVKFISDTPTPYEPYTSTLRQLGIEVLFGPAHQEHIRKWMMENRESINYFFINRPEISKDYINLIKEETSAKVLYYGQDLLYLRLERELQYAYHPETQNLVHFTKDIERMLLNKVDVAYYPSIEEVRILNQEFPHVVKRAIPLFLFDQRPDYPTYDFQQRNNLLFVAGFDHNPNTDAAIWFVREVFPLILKAHPRIKLFLVGSNPNERIKALQSNAVIVTGAVSDERLAQFYHHCRMSVVPLRYGAGVKGKVIEAMYNGVPVVTTSVGAEGLFTDHDIPLTICDQPQDMARQISALYSNPDALKNLSERSIQYIERHFSRENAKRILLQDIEL